MDEAGFFGTKLGISILVLIALVLCLAGFFMGSILRQNYLRGVENCQRDNHGLEGTDVPPDACGNSNQFYREK